MTEDELYDLSDEELEAVFKEAKDGGIEVDYGEEASEEEVVEETTETEDEVEVEEEAEEELEEEDTEQPGDDEDSDQEEEETEEEEESTEDPDEDAEDDLESNEEESQPTPEIKKHKYKANGQEFEFTEDEVLEQFGKVFGQSMNYTQKMQEIAPWRKTIGALKDNDISHEDVNLLIDVMKGDKDAIATVVKKAGIDTLELDTGTEVQYTPKEYGQSDEQIALDDVISVIGKDKEFGITQHVVDSQWDKQSREVLASRPEFIQGLHNDIKSGLFDKVSPMAMKMKVLDGGSKSDLEYYIEAGKVVTQGMAQEEAQVQERAKAQQEAAEVEKAKVEAVKKQRASQKATKKAATKRKAAAPTKKVAGKKDVIDYLDDEEFVNWEKEYKAKYG